MLKLYFSRGTSLKILDLRTILAKQKSILTGFWVNSFFFPEPLALQKSTCYLLSFAVYKKDVIMHNFCFGRGKMLAKERHTDLGVIYSMYVFLTWLSSSLSPNHWITSLISLVSVLRRTCVAAAGEKWGEKVPKGEGSKTEIENYRETRRKGEEKNPYEVFILWIFFHIFSLYCWKYWGKVNIVALAFAFTILWKRQITFLWASRHHCI